MTGKGESSRARAPNFSRGEQVLLTRALEDYSHIIESKRTDNIKQAQKQDAWVKVTQIFNASTKHVPRTTENLISCYRNMKSKIKKQHSEAKMNLKDSSEALLNAIDENGKDWEVVSHIMNQPTQVCKSSFENLQKIFIKNDKEHKRAILGTGGGPPPSTNDYLDRMKKLIEPQVDGLYTVYDGDAMLMKQYQQTVPLKDRILPIEHDYIAHMPCKDVAEVTIEKKENYVNMPCEDVAEVIIENREIYVADSQCEDVQDIVVNKEKQRSFSEGATYEQTPKKMQCDIRPIINRTEILKKKKACALICNDKGEPSNRRQRNVSDSLLMLTEEKLELVRLQKMSEQMKIKMQQLEMDDLIKQNEHKEEIRQRELILLDLQIKKLQ